MINSVKKITQVLLIGTLLLLKYSDLNAQSYHGFLHENYSGVNSVINNPANIADSRFSFDLNLAGVSAAFHNNIFASESISNLSNDNFDIDDDLIQTFLSSNAVYTNIDILGPSFLVNINPKNTISVYTRVRTLGDVYLNGEDLNQIEDFDDFDIEDPNFNFDINQPNTGVDIHAWSEIGLSYARVIKQDNQHFLKGGFTLKYLVGIASGYARTNNLTGNYQGNQDGADLFGGNVDLDGALEYGLSYDDFESTDNIELDNLELPRSIGFDIGAVYEWRPEYESFKTKDKHGNDILDPSKNKYKLRVGISITDIGNINYKEGTVSNYQINSESIDFINDLQGVVSNDISTLSQVTDVLNDNQAFIDQLADGIGFSDLVNDIQNATSLDEVETLLNNNSEELQDLIDNIEDPEELEQILTDFNIINSQLSNGFKSSLPTALHVNADWSFNKNLFLNLSTDISLTSRTKANKVSIANQVALTPRYESRVFSFYSPVRIEQGTGFEWGAGMRLGPLYIGSGSILSNLIGGNIQGADVYAGVKIPLLRSRKKDKDGDGVKDKKDDCIEVPGEIDNKGCPWPDTDGDSVLDKDDKCPEEAGEVDNNGCPWPDTDGDGVLNNDDTCPEEPGPAENKGCPWTDTDGDSVPDKDDECPELPGDVATKGCPDTDGDSVPDKDDACIDVMGTLANNGCPEVTETIQKELNAYAKTILFNSGKASIKDDSTNALVDIIAILNEYPNAKFTVEGHTDSIGSATTNKKLSNKRANAVKDFLVKNGVSTDRLTAVGYGEEKPIATNLYKDGRKQNRRVEINLIK